MVCYALLGATSSENFRYSSWDVPVKTCHSPAPPAGIFGRTRSKLQLLHSVMNNLYIVLRRYHSNSDLDHAIYRNDNVVVRSCLKFKL